MEAQLLGVSVQKTKTEVETILLAQLQKNAAKNMHDRYHYGGSSQMWRNIFEQVFGRPPHSDDDPLWNMLLHKNGYAALDVAISFLNNQVEEERAS